MTKMYTIFYLFMLAATSLMGCKSLEAIPTVQSNASKLDDSPADESSTASRVFYRGRLISDPEEIKKLMDKGAVFEFDSTDTMIIYDTEASFASVDGARLTDSKLAAVKQISGTEKYMYYHFALRYPTAIGHTYFQGINILGPVPIWATRNISADWVDITAKAKLGNGKFATTLGTLGKTLSVNSILTVSMCNTTSYNKRVTFTLDTGKKIINTITPRGTWIFKSKGYITHGVSGYIIGHTVVNL